jgi:hypothetical protein
MATPHRLSSAEQPSIGKPGWLKVRLPHGEAYERVKGLVKDLHRHRASGPDAPTSASVGGHRDRDADGRNCQLPAT